jgi:cytochrome oxidase assembly protein ShyY1
VKRLPLLPTLLVALAVATMTGLGIWQLQRKAEKEALLARYAAARDLPPVPWPGSIGVDQAPLFRRSTVECSSIRDWRTEGGRNRAGKTGWLHIASCSNGATVVAGWSDRPDPVRWAGGSIAGVIGADRQGVRLVATAPAPGLQPPREPSAEDVPNNHLFYALQWFFFAGAAAVIYLLALRRRSR